MSDDLWDDDDAPPGGRYGGAGAGAVGRAPRLRPDQLLADSITRVGRFARIDPTQGRELPKVTHILGAVGWAVLIGESFRRAWARRDGQG